MGVPPSPSEEFKPPSRSDISGRYREMFFLCSVGQSMLHDDFRPHQLRATFDQFTHSSHKAQKKVLWQENTKQVFFFPEHALSVLHVKNELDLPLWYYTSFY